MNRLWVGLVSLALVIAIGAKNAARYTPFVALVEAVDAGRAVALYQRL